MVHKFNYLDTVLCEKAYEGYISKLYIGRNKNGDFVQAEINDQGVIRGFNGLVYIPSDGMVDGLAMLHPCSWTHETILDSGLVLKSGEIIKTKAISESKTKALKNKNLDILEYSEVYVGDATFCEKCGMGHVTEQYGPEPTFLVVKECTLVCRDCADTEDLLTPLEAPADIFRSRDMQGLDLDAEKYELVDTLFCDSSGFGAPHESALTQEQVEARVNELLDQHGYLYSGLTGVGQFQVYVSIWRPKLRVVKGT